MSLYTMKQMSLWLLGGTLCAGLAACDSKSPKTEQKTDTLALKQDTVPATPALNTLTAEEQGQGFRLLFDGSSLKGFHSYLKDSVVGWKVEDGAIVCPGKTGADLVSNEEFENFELTWEWKITPQGNSGVMFRVIEDKKYMNTYETAPEYQLIDDNGYPDKLTDKQKSGANYDMNAPVKFMAKAPGEWNQSRLVVNNNQVEHWLNGEKVVAYEYGGTEWKKNLAVSKFKTWGYATPHNKGKLAFQDHDHVVYFRNLKIKTL
jgi:hypothetical protein